MEFVVCLSPAFCFSSLNLWMIISRFDKHPDPNFKNVVGEVKFINLGLSDAQFFTGETSDNFHPPVMCKNNFFNIFLYFQDLYQAANQKMCIHTLLCTL